MNKKLFIPLGVFLVLVGFLFVGLFLNPREVPSPLIGKPAPQFTLNQLHQPGKTLGTPDMKGQVWLLNVWASWCVSCREEHPLLVELGKAKLVPIIGLNYKDEPAAGMKWLAVRRRVAPRSARRRRLAFPAATVLNRQVDQVGNLHARRQADLLG